MSDDNGGRRTEDLSLTVDLIREPSFWSAIMATKASENTSLPKVRDNLAGLLDSRVGLGRGGRGV